jgi:hypothetical protein
MKKFKFPDSSVWFLYGEGYKVFVPFDLVVGFEKFVSKNKFEAKPCGVYNYTSKQKKTKDRNEGILADGKDYIIKRESKDLVISWLKSAYKEIG